MVGLACGPPGGLGLRRPPRRHLRPSPSVSDHLGDPERVLLRRGDHHGAESRRRVLSPVIAGRRALGLPRSSRGDVAIAILGEVPCRQMTSDSYTDNIVGVESHARLGSREVGRLVHFARVRG